MDNRRLQCSPLEAFYSCGFYAVYCVRDLGRNIHTTLHVANGVPHAVPFRFGMVFWELLGAWLVRQSLAPLREALLLRTLRARPVRHDGPSRLMRMRVGPPPQ